MIFMEVYSFSLRDEKVSQSYKKSSKERKLLEAAVVSSEQT